MKKIIPIIAALGVGSLIAFGSTQIKDKKESFIGNLNAFHNDLKDYTSFNEKNLTKTALNKYNLSILSDDLQDINENKENISVLNDANATIKDSLANEEEKLTETIDNVENDMNKESIEQEDEEKNEITEQISTLYSLSSDIETSCDDFCDLKEDITNAIIETQNLIKKIESKELELTQEQRMFITEQSMQLKNLGRQLSNITTELSFHLSDLNQIMTTNSGDIDTLNLKYLIVLDNLVNGNEMLQSSLSNLNLINQMFNMSSTLPPNNHGRILYGFQHNNNPPVVKDYYIDENGQLINNNETTEEKTQDENSDENIVEVERDEKDNVDTYKNSSLKTNIDTYQNTNVQRNIDSFFNTALLDNEFMYGNGNYGYGGYNRIYGPQNPYINNYTNYERSNTLNGSSNNQVTQNTDNDNKKDSSNSKSKKDKKRIQLKKNIDTYKDENEPDIKTKLGNIKNSINGFFQKFKTPKLKTDLNDKIDNPIYRFKTQKEN